MPADDGTDSSRVKWRLRVKLHVASDVVGTTAFANQIHPKAGSEACLLHVLFLALMFMMVEL